MKKAWESGGEEDEDEEEFSEYKYFGYSDSFNNKVFSIEKKYEIDDFDYDPENIDTMFGNKIEVYMDTIGQPIDEYLVNFTFFKDIMEENGFKIVTPSFTRTNIFRKEYFKDGLGQFERIDELAEMRRTNALRYNSYLQGVKGITLPVEKNWAKMFTGCIP